MNIERLAEMLHFAASFPSSLSLSLSLPSLFRLVTNEKGTTRLDRAPPRIKNRGSDFRKLISSDNWEQRFPFRESFALLPNSCNLEGNHVLYVYARPSGTQTFFIRRINENPSTFNSSIRISLPRSFSTAFKKDREGSLLLLWNAVPLEFFERA